MRNDGSYAQEFSISMGAPGMEPLEQRVDRLEAMVSAHLEQTAEKVALSPNQAVGGGAAAGFGSFIKWMGAEAPKFLAAAVLLVMGYYIKDSVDLSIKQRQLDLSYAKEMQGFLQKMADESADTAQLESTAIVLASYGKAALPSLLNEMRHSGMRADAAATAMSLLGIIDHEAVCQALPSVLRSRGRQYEWQVHLKAVHLLADNNCTEAVKPLKKYREIVVQANNGQNAAFKDIVLKLPNAPAEDYKYLLEGIDKSLKMLDR
jgi:hypothetical protein